MMMNEAKVLAASGQRRRWSLPLMMWSAVLAIPVFAGGAMAQDARELKLTPPAGDTVRKPGEEPRLAPILNENLKNRIPGQYIVVFKPGTSRETVMAAQETVKKLGGTIGHTYTTALIGFSVKLPAEGEQAQRALQTLRALPGVAHIEADQVGSLNTIWNQPPTPSGAPPTGLDRITQRLLPLDGTYTYDGAGAGVNVYVIDTGVRATHTEFGGRVSGGVNTMDPAAGTGDCHGHGTHVAGTIAGATYGVAKQAQIHPVRAGDCANTYLAPVIAAVDWVTANRVLPAVANLSSGFGNSPALNTAVTNSVASGVTYAVAAGNASTDACNTSPALVPAAITVGAIDPSSDTRAGFSNTGTCVDLFAPGVNIVSAGIASDTATATKSGTSMAAPHVAGVAARYLASFPGSTPAQVWARLDLMADAFPATPGWAGVIDPGTGSPNKLLYWGAVNDAFDDGDPHLTTVSGTRYDFQSAGEFVALRNGKAMEIQTRQTPVATTWPDAYDGLATCLALNTAVAVRVGTHRVSYEPNISGVPDPSGLQLRVDGKLTTLGAAPLDLGSGGRVLKTGAPGGIEIDFPDDTALYVTPYWWGPQSRWYLNVDVAHTQAQEGIMGAIPRGSWLPALPNGASMGPMPGALHDRYVELYQKFAGAWRVTGKTSLFDYKPGTSTRTFTIAAWPQEHGPCVLPPVRGMKPAKPLTPVAPAVAQRACEAITGKGAHENCVFDVRFTGDTGFAKGYELSQAVLANAAKQRPQALDCPPKIYLANNATTPDGMKGNGGFLTYDLASSVPRGAGKSCRYTRTDEPNWDPFIGRNLAADEASAAPSGADAWRVTLKDGGTRSVTCPATIDIGPVAMYAGPGDTMPPLPAAWHVTAGDMQTLKFDTTSNQLPFALRCNYHGVSNVVLDVAP